MKFFEAVANVFRIPDLRKRILFTLAMLAIYRLGGHIPTPGIDANQLQKFFEQNQGTIFGFVDLFSGGMLRRLTIFALGIMPYITASIILQLLTVVVLTHQWTVLHLVIIIAIMVAVVGFIVLVERGERRIPVQYAKRVVGRRMMGGQSTHLPLKVNAGGVIPVIFASSLLAFPTTLLNMSWVQHSNFLKATLGSIGSSMPLYYVFFVALIMFFCFFYVSIIFNPNEAADNMRKYGGFIPGIRPGKNTAEYMDKILSKITVVGGLYLSILSLIPMIMISGIKLQRLPFVGNFIDAHFPRWLLDCLGVNFYFGGTSLLIVVGVAMDTVNQIEAQLIMRHYEGFTPRAGRIRGRRSSI